MARAGRDANRGVIVGAIAGAAVFHVFVLLIAAAHFERPAPLSARSVAAAPLSWPALADEFKLHVAEVVLIDEEQLAAFVEASAGAADVGGLVAEHPSANAAIDMPGVHASGASGASSGPTMWSGRNDQETAHNQLWNDRNSYQTPRTRNNRRATSPEAIARAPKRSFDDRNDRSRRARTGTEVARAGEEVGDESPISKGELAPRNWQAADPRFDTTPQKRTTAARDGGSRAGSSTAQSDSGRPSVESHNKGSVSDRVDSVAKSAETKPTSIEFSRSGTGGNHSGSTGKRGTGAVRSGPGSAATASSMASGTPSSLRAKRSNPYFRDLYRRLDRQVHFPKALAAALEQGTVIVTFTLSAKGQVSSIRVTRSSGFKGFDNALTSALRQAGPFGQVPASILAGRQSVVIRAPYTFRNPLIR